MFKAFVRTDNSPAQLFIRLALGIVMFPHGAQKVFGWFGGPGLEQTLLAFSNMGFSPWATYILMVIEYLGSIFLIIGCLTRLWSFGLGITITICMFMNHVQHGFFMNWFGQQGGEGVEYHILVIGMAIALTLRGGGMLSVDRSLTSDRRRGGIIF